MPQPRSPAERIRNAGCGYNPSQPKTTRPEPRPSCFCSEASMGRLKLESATSHVRRSACTERSSAGSSLLPASILWLSCGTGAREHAGRVSLQPCHLYPPVDGLCCLLCGGSFLPASSPSQHQCRRPGLLTCGTALLSWHLLVSRTALIADDSAVRQTTHMRATQGFPPLRCPGEEVPPQTEEGKGW